MNPSETYGGTPAALALHTLVAEESKATQRRVGNLIHDYYSRIKAIKTDDPVIAETLYSMLCDHTCQLAKDSASVKPVLSYVLNVLKATRTMAIERLPR